MQEFMLVKGRKYKKSFYTIVIEIIFDTGGGRVKDFWGSGRKRMY
jgi:hypothetical protein